MKRKILLITFLVLAVILSVSAISANDVNVTDSYATNLVDDSSDDSVLTSDEADSSEVSSSNDDNAVSNIVDDSSKVSLSSDEVLGSDDSNNLSTNNLGSSLDSDTLGASSTKLVASDLTMYYNGGDKLKATLVDSSGNGIAGQKVIFHIVGKDYTVTTNANGVASLPINLKIGSYPATISYAGTSQYSAAKDVPVKVNVYGTIKSNDVVKYYKGSTNYAATFVDSQNNPLANTEVKVTVSGKTYTLKTNSAGVAKLAINLKPGTYPITAENPVTGYKLTTNIKVLSTVSSSDLRKVRTDSKKFTATFLDSEGKKLANTNVKFIFYSGKSSKTYTAKTNSEGVASLAIGAGPGTYTIKSVNVDGISNTNTITVYKIVNSKINTNSYIFYPGDTRKVEATLLNALGYAPGAGKTVTLTVNGRTYTGTTNSKGVVSFTLLSSLGSGSYSATYKFAGNDFYNPSTATDKIVVLTSRNTALTVKSSSTFGKGAGTPFKVALTASGVPFAKKPVYITVSGKTYTTITDSNGIASLPINLGIGTHEISYQFKGDDKLYSSSGKTSITVKARTATSLTWKSETTLNQGSHTYKVLLLDSSKKALSGKTVKLTVNKATYTATTASNGYASFNVNLPVGTYSASYSFAGDNSYAPSQGSATLVINKNTNKVGGYWVFGGDMYNVNLATLASKGTSDIFLNYYAVSKYGKTAVENWIGTANKNGIRVHIWMQAFYNGNWINPKTASSATINSIVNEAKSYAQMKGVSGVHLDYLRYPGNAYQTSGGTEAINSFVQKVVTTVHGVNPNCIVSAALMPETTDNIKYYGQDMSTLSKYLDVVVPMIYKGNYNSGTSWITTTTKWFISNSKGAQVWAGLQSYVSDSNTAKLSTSELTKDCQAAYSGGATGVVLFRWGLSNFVDFGSSSSSSSSTPVTGKVSINSIITGAKYIQSYFKSNGKLPGSVKVTEGSFTTREFLYLMCKATVQLASGNTNPIAPIGTIKEQASTEQPGIYNELLKADYIETANKVVTYITNNKQAPAYGTSAVGNIIFAELVDAYSRIVAFYGDNSKSMPNYVTIKQGKVTPSSYPSSITALAKQLTSGLTSERAKAVALYNWVRDYISYSFYYDTQKGASGTLTSRSGNCCDQAQLLVALARSSGLTARFATGYCAFSSGNSYGHVWVQIKVSGSWHAVDTTSTRNTFDSIVNWNTKSYTNRGVYDVLPY